MKFYKVRQLMLLRHKPRLQGRKTIQPGEVKGLMLLRHGPRLQERRDMGRRIEIGEKGLQAGEVKGLIPVRHRPGLQGSNSTTLDLAI
jgi:hypothetical protein